MSENNMHLQQHTTLDPLAGEYFVSAFSEAAIAYKEMRNDLAHGEATQRGSIDANIEAQKELHALIDYHISNENPVTVTLRDPEVKVIWALGLKFRHKSPDSATGVILPGTQNGRSTSMYLRNGRFSRSIAHIVSSDGEPYVKIDI